MARNSRELAKRPVVDPQDEPSAEWGWHGSLPGGTIAGGVVTIILCAAFFVGPYQTTTQDLWLGGVILVILAGIALQIRKKRNSWRR